MPPSITIPLAGCDLHVWGFAIIPHENCIECHTCGAKYDIDKLRGVAVRRARFCGTAQVSVYCCIRPAISGARSVDTLARDYGVDCSAVPATPEQREPAVCRWCKGKREITVNFKTKPCDCVKGDGTVGQTDVGVGWKVKKTFIASV